MGRIRPVELGNGDRYVPLSEAVHLLGAPSVAALRNRIYRSPNPAQEGYEKRGGRWFVLVRDPETRGGPTESESTTTPSSQFRSSRK